MTIISNHEIARFLFEIGTYLDMENVPFKPRAYEKAAQAIEGLGKDARDIYKDGGVKALGEIPGVGFAIAEHIEEYLKTGRIARYAELKKKIPVELGDLMAIEGLGPKSIKKLYVSLGIKNLKDIEKAVRVGAIAKLPGFGKKSEENIAKGIAFVKRSQGRFLIGDAIPIVHGIEERLRKLKDVEKLVVAGSLRRRKETIGDVDMLVVSRRPKPIMDFFVAMPEVTRVYAHGRTKSAIQLSSGLDVDIRVVPKESCGAALNYFTGSKDHNVALRKIAIKKGFKLNEYGLFRRDSKGASKMIAGATEKELYEALDMAYIEPELREMRGEIAAAQKNVLPKLVEYDDCMGDLQVQTNWTDGANSIEEMAREAIRRGLSYIAITDHTKRLAMTNGLDGERIKKQWVEIDRVNKKFKGKIVILKGTECDILKDGTLDLPDEILARLDVVGISVHSHFNLNKKDQTERIIHAMKNPHADILFHPTGRLIQKREAYEVDIRAIINTSKETGTVLEVNAHPERLDLNDEHIRMCVEAGVKMAIDSDAHAAGHIGYLEYGIAQARRGWAKKSDIINTRPLSRMRKLLK